MNRQIKAGWTVVALAVSACGPQEVKSAEPQAEQATRYTQLACPDDRTAPVTTPLLEKLASGSLRVALTATDNCTGVNYLGYTLSGATTGSGSASSGWTQLFISSPGATTITYYARDYAGNTEQPHSITVTPSSACSPVRLDGFNLFLRGTYSGGRTVGGKVMASTINLQDFSIGGELAADDIDNVLTADNQLNIHGGAIYGNAYYGTSTTADQTTAFIRGQLAHSQVGEFTTLDAQLPALSDDLRSQLTANGTVHVEPWGGIFLEGSDPQLNVFTVDSGAFSTAVYRSISAPAGSVAVLNFSDATAVTLANSGISLSGVDSTGVLYNFPQLGTLDIHNFVLQGTVLAPRTSISFSNASLEGAIYGQNLTGNGEAHIYKLREFEFCRNLTP